MRSRRTVAQRGCTVRARDGVRVGVEGQRSRLLN